MELGARPETWNLQKIGPVHCRPQLQCGALMNLMSKPWAAVVA